MTRRSAPAAAAIAALATLLGIASPASARDGRLASNAAVGVTATVPPSCRVERSPSQDGRSFDATATCDAAGGWRLLAIPVVPIDGASATVDGTTTALDQPGGTVVASGDGPVRRTMHVDLSLPDLSPTSAVMLVIVPRT